MRSRLATLAAYACAGLFILSAGASRASRGNGNPVPVLPFWWGDKVRVAICADRTTWGLHYVRDIDRATLPDGWRGGGVHYRAFGFQFEWQEWGLSGVTGTGWKSAARYGTVGIPVALVLPLLGAFPIRHFYRRIALRRRARSGLCLNCGYDLRCTPACCPECGRRPSSAL